MTCDLSPIFPRPPRRLARHENRGTVALIAMGLLLLIGISALIPAMNEEERLAERRERVWHEGVAVDGVIEAKNRSKIGRKEVQYRYRVNEKEYTDERIITHVDDFDSLKVDAPITLRFDPKEPQFSATALDVVPSFEDWIPIELLVGIVFVVGGLMALWGFHRRCLLRNGIEVPCTVEPTSSPNFVRVTYAWHGAIRTRLVEGKCMSGKEQGALLLDPTFPAWPVLGMHDRFAQSGTCPPASLPDLRRRWANALLLGTIGAWVSWGLLSLLTGESMSPHLRTACILIVGIVLAFIGGRSESDSRRQSASDSDHELE